MEAATLPWLVMEFDWPKIPVSLFFYFFLEICIIKMHTALKTTQICGPSLPLGDEICSSDFEPFQGWLVCRSCRTTSPQGLRKDAVAQPYNKIWITNSFPLTLPEKILIVWKNNWNVWKIGIASYTLTSSSNKLGLQAAHAHHQF